MDNDPRDAHGQRIYRAALLVMILIAAPIAAQDSPTGFRSYPLKHVHAQDIAARVRDALGGAAAHAQVLVDTQQNQLVVKGSDDVQRVAKQILATLDQPPVSKSRNEKDPARPVEVGRPVEVARPVEVKAYRVTATDLPAIAKQLQAKFRTAPEFRVVMDEPTQRLVVVANAETHTEIDRYLRTLDGNNGAASDNAPAALSEGTTYALRNVTWRDLEEELRKLWGPELLTSGSANGDTVNVTQSSNGSLQRVMQIDRRANQVTFFGNGRTVSMWNTFVTAFDAPRNDVTRATGFVTIRNADPALVLSTVSLIQPATKKAAAGNVTQAIQIGAPKRDVRSRTGSDMVSMIFHQQPQDRATQPEPAAKPAQPPTTPAAKPDDPPQVTESVPLGDQTATDAADTALVGNVQIEIINDVIILRGRADDVAKVKKMIEEIEQLSRDTQPVFEIHELQYVICEAVDILVRELYEEILTERQGPVSIRALVEPNAILLIGRKESVNVVKELLIKLDQPSVPASRFEIFRLKNAAAVDAEATVRNFFSNTPGADTEVRPGIGTRVRIISDFRTNSLIVQASPRDLDEVRRLIESIDVEDIPAAAEFRIFKLKNALATDLATVLQTAITGSETTTTTTTATGGTTSGTSTPSLPSNALQMFMVDQSKSELIRSGILIHVQVTADANTNALLVRAPAKSMDLIAALIDQLDRLPDVSALIKVFTIVNGDATSLATMLQTLFGLTSTTTGGIQTNATLGGTTTTTLPTAAGAGDQSVVPLRLSVDLRTNSIIASGSDSDLRVVETILLRLDETLDDRKLTVVRLRNTQASAVSTAIQSYLTTRQTRIQQQLTTNGATSVYEQIDQEVFIVAEDITNSIIVSATPKYIEEVLAVIKELDVRQPMVLVQVLIAEVELNNTFQFGVELGFQESLLFDRGRAALNSLALGTDQSVPGFNFNTNGHPNANSAFRQDLGGQTLSTFSLGRADPTLGYGGLVVSAASDSVSILLRALEDKGMAQVLSRPQVMTMHNQPAYVQVGQDVARITGSTLSTFGTQNNVQDVSTGLILSILPLINDDGIVVLGVEAERSSLGDEAQGTTVAIDSNGNAVRVAPINVTRASTTISARSGQTVVFAGLITKNNTVSLRRIPYLSDIPIIGHAFEFKNNFERRTELLVVMTPYVIRDEADMEMYKIQESERMSWCLADVMSVGADTWGLQGGHCLFCNKDVPMIFPDMNPTGMEVEMPPTLSPTPAGPPTPPNQQSHRRGGQFQPQSAAAEMIPTETDSPQNAPVPTPPVVWPDQPRPETAAAPRIPQSSERLLPTSVTYGKPRLSNGVSPANYQPNTNGTVRLPPAP